MSARPNILIVMTDHQRGDTALPEHPCKTPYLDRLSREGVIFTETFCPTPHCCPSRATFMTGLYPSRHGVWNNVCNNQRLSRGLSEGVRCWSEDLRDLGYDLRYTGKWHVSIDENPSDRGWTEIGHVSGTGRDHHGTRWEQWQKQAAQPEPETRSEGQILRPGWGAYTIYGANENGNMHDVQATATGVEAIRDLADASDPWCLYVGLTGPHDPYFVPQKYLDMYDLDDIELPPSYADEMTGKPVAVQRVRKDRWGQLSEREVRETIRHFWAYCTFLDDLFGQLLGALDETGQTQDTLVIFTADHGDYCGDHGLFCKGIPCYRGAYHVPNVMHWPGGIQNPGRRVDKLVSLADIGPTLLELAGGTPDPTLTGQSLAPFLRDETPGEWRDAIFTQCDGVELYYTQRSVTTKTHKYVYNGFDWDELYDLREDPHEMINRNDDPAYQEIKHDLVKRMWRFARDEQDSAVNAYITVSFAPWGPMEAFR